MAKIEPWDQIKSVNIDYPFEQKGDYRLDGVPVQNFIAIKELIDRAIELGFNAIGFDTNVPIDIRTGELQLSISREDAPDYSDVNSDKSFSEVVWQGIEYAESMGLKTSIDLNIRNALNDVAITTSSIPTTLDVNTLFESIKYFETQIANRAQSAGVDSIRIGNVNFGFSTVDYEQKWSEIIDSIRSVYEGSLSYQSYVWDGNNIIWDLVDVVKVEFNPKWPLQSSFTSEDIASLYLTPYLSANKNLSYQSALDSVLSLIDRYPDKKIELQVRFIPGESAGHEFDDIFSYVFEHDTFSVNAKDQSTLTSYPEEWIDTNLNNQKIAGFLEFFGNYLKNDISALQFWQYMPWAEANWIRNPSNNIGQAWQSFTKAGGALNWNPEGEKVISSYFTKEWGFSTLHFGSESNDIISGSSVDDKFFSSAGDDRFDGQTGFDRLIYSSAMSTFEIAKVDGAYQVRGKSNSDNTDTVINIERLEFSDTSLALDIAGHAGITAKLLGATFGKESLANKALVGIGLSYMDAGTSYSDLMGAVINAVLGSTASNAAVVELLYTNVIGSAPSANDLAFFTDWLDKGIYTKASFGVLAADTELNIVNVGLVGLASTGLEYTPYVA
jgi:hypothetical protein